jgi:citrate lyase subunit beta / citryl-CoA lyase
MRSLLFIPGDSEKKLVKGLTSGADILLIDLEDSVSIAQKPVAREITAAFLKAYSGHYVRVNALDTGLIDDDLAAIMPYAPVGIMLPKSESGHDVTHLGAKLAVYEAMYNLPPTRILPVATETGRSIFGLNTYNSPRLSGLTWGAEDLAADIGAETNRAEDGRHSEPFRIARSMLLFGAAAAGVDAIDTIYPSFKNDEGLRRECLEARRDGFIGKMAIHPAQIAIINEVFTPAPEVVARARKIVEAFAANPALGVIAIDGEMIDKPHLRAAERVLKRLN